MATEYLCKVCRGLLNVKTSIVLSASKVNSSERGLIFLNPEIGNYLTTTHPSFKIEEGEEYIYTCPICHSQLNSAKYKNLVRIIMIDDDKKEYNIYFSGIAGEKCTYKIRGNKVEAKTGPDVKIYDKYFEVPEEDRKYL
jgi:RNA polymerase subunit RPABC4/transcription elongation factor Spt4